MHLARLAAAALALAAALPARAERPRVVVDAPDFHPLPLAVAHFLVEGDARAATEAAEVVRADLTRSGLFEVLDPKGFIADPGEGLAASSIKFSRWADVGAEGMLLSRLSPAVIIDLTPFIPPISRSHRSTVNQLPREAIAALTAWRSHKKRLFSFTAPTLTPMPATPTGPMPKRKPASRLATFSLLLGTCHSGAPPDALRITRWVTELRFPDELSAPHSWVLTVNA